MPLYTGKYATCTFLQNMRNMLRSHDRYKPVSLIYGMSIGLWRATLYMSKYTNYVQHYVGSKLQLTFEIHVH